MDTLNAGDRQTIFATISLFLFTLIRISMSRLSSLRYFGPCLALASYGEKVEALVREATKYGHA